jgi:toxin CcdB
MARFDLYRRLRATAGYLVDVQSDLLSDLQTRVVVPLFPGKNWQPVMARLNPIFDIDGELHVLVTQSIATVPKRELGNKVGSLAHYHDEITIALDMLLTGF